MAEAGRLISVKINYEGKPKAVKDFTAALKGRKTEGARLALDFMEKERWAIQYDSRCFWLDPAAADDNSNYPFAFAALVKEFPDILFVFDFVERRMESGWWGIGRYFCIYDGCEKVYDTSSYLTEYEYLNSFLKERGDKCDLRQMDGETACKTLAKALIKEKGEKPTAEKIRNYIEDNDTELFSGGEEINVWGYGGAVLIDGHNYEWYAKNLEDGDSAFMGEGDQEWDVSGYEAYLGFKKEQIEDDGSWPDLNADGYYEQFFDLYGQPDGDGGDDDGGDNDWEHWDSIEDDESESCDDVNDLAINLRDEGKFDEALALHDKAVSLAGNDIIDKPMTLSARGWTYYHKGDYQKALADLDESLRLEPDNESRKERRKEILEKLNAAAKNPSTLDDRAKKPGKSRRIDDADTETVKKAPTAVQQDGLALEDVPENLKTAEMCLLAVRQDGLMLEYVPENLRTAALCLVACYRNNAAIKYVPKHLREIVKLCNGLKNVEKDPKILISSVMPEKNKTPEFYLASIYLRPESLRYIPDRSITPEMCLAAVRQDGSTLEYVPEALKAQVKQAAEASPAPKKCANCGGVLWETAKFCGHCGTKVE